MRCDWAARHMTPLTPKQGTQGGCRHALSFRQHQEHRCRSVLLHARSSTQTKKQTTKTKHPISRFGKFHCRLFELIPLYRSLPLLLIYQTNRHTDLFLPEENTKHTLLLFIEIFTQQQVRVPAPHCKQLLSLCLFQSGKHRFEGAFRGISFPLKYSGALGIFRFIRARITECFITFELRAVQAYPGIKKKALP